MRLLVFGSRGWTDEEAVSRCLERLRPDVVIHGAAPGADSCANRVARRLDIPVEPFPVTPQEWTRYGRAAGPMRNQRMIDEGKPDRAAGFRMPGRSNGTDDMHRRFLRSHIPTILEVR